MSIRYLTLLITTACNLRCAYCYRNPETKPEIMPRELIEQAMKKAARSGKRFHVQLTGGEPTTEPKTVEWIGAYVRAMRWPATIGLQSNGTLIDSSLAEICKRYDIQVGISLDGPIHIQEQLRGSGASTLNGLKTLAAHDVPFCVTCVVTKQNVLDLGKLALVLAGFPNAMGLGCDLLVQKGNVLKNQDVCPASAAALEKGLVSLMQILRQINIQRYIPLVLREAELLSKAARQKNSNLFCHACRGESLAVHPDGSVYPCGQTVGDSRFYCGTLEDLNPAGLTALEEYRLHNDACGDCPLNGCCPGDCPSRLYYNQEPYRHLACAMYQAIRQRQKKEI